MRSFAFAASLSFLGLAACTMPGVESTESAAATSALSGTVIHYAQSGCYGACPMFEVDVSSDGQGVYKGVYKGTGFVAEKGERRFTLTPAQYRAFQQAVAPARSDGTATYGNSAETCQGQPTATDGPTLNISWSEPGADTDRLSWYASCRAASFEPQRKQIWGAWKQLPIEDWVGTAENRFSYGAPS